MDAFATIAEIAEIATIRSVRRGACPPMLAEALWLMAWAVKCDAGTRRPGRLPGAFSRLDSRHDEATHPRAPTATPPAMIASTSIDSTA